ncbi:hypothetical protein [Vampirovibrio chlorellavorus]|uniref:hypothetical protein n=1 Tax=Vampirovibrio chlorellavorus TaxID=758823 RepID=UPI0026EB71B9|nr:hypothetical protein [Vampirovibrio chlorellavorus]
MKANIISALEYSTVIEGQIKKYETQLEEIVIAINQGQKPKVSQSFNTIRTEIRRLTRLLEEFRNQVSD